MPKNRFKYIPEFLWPYLGDAFKGINEDLTALEAGGYGTGGTGVTSWFQLNDKPNLSAVATSGAYADLTGRPSIPDVSGFAPKANPTFTGTVSGVTKAMVGLGNVDNVADNMKALDGAQIRSGTIHPARLGSGTRDGSRFLADDGTWRAVTASGGNVITTGPYALDPKRAPAGTVVLVPAGTPVLTHVGNRFVGAATGQPVTEATSGATGTLTLTAAGSAIAKYADGGSFEGKIARLTTSTTATNIGVLYMPMPAGVTEMQMSIVMQVPAMTTDNGIIALYRGNQWDFGVDAKNGNAANTINYITDSWKWVSPDVPTSSKVRVAIAADIGTGSNGRRRLSVFRINADGSETQVGTTYELGGQPSTSGNTFSSVNIGKIVGKASMEGKDIDVHSVRVAYGPGAYSLGVLRDERLYPAAI